MVLYFFSVLLLHTIQTRHLAEWHMMHSPTELYSLVPPMWREDSHVHCAVRFGSVRCRHIPKIWPLLPLRISHCFVYRWRREWRKYSRKKKRNRRKRKSKKQHGGDAPLDGMVYQQLTTSIPHIFSYQQTCLCVATGNKMKDFHKIIKFFGLDNKKSIMFYCCPRHYT